MPDSSYILEFVRIGNQVKVTACDTQTGIEAVVFGPAQTPQKAMGELAIKKLHYVLQKNADKESGSADEDA